MSVEPKIISAAKRQSLELVRKCLPHSSPRQVNAAFLQAIEIKWDAGFDLLALHWKPGLGDFAPLGLAASRGYSRGIDRLLPTASPAGLTDALRLALEAAHPPAALQIIAALPPGHDCDPIFDRAVSCAPLQVVQALVPFVSRAALQKGLFPAALFRPEHVSYLASLPGADVPKTIQRLLDFAAWPDQAAEDPDHILSGAALRHGAADVLLALVAREDRPAIVRAHPGLRAHPNGQAAELDEVIAQGAGNRPRM